MRFRTDSQLESVIRDVAASEPDSVELVDVAGAIASSCPHGIVGNETLYEHVHLTFYATWQVAGLLFARVSQDLAQAAVFNVT